MSPNRGRQLARQAPSQSERPSLDRPSLFAGMEAGDSIVPEDDEGPRGGILSTLESVRQRKAMPRVAAGRSRSGGSPWGQRALWGLMGVGVVSLLGAFVMVVHNGHTQAVSAEKQMERDVLARMDSNQGASQPHEARDLNVLAAPAAGTATPPPAPPLPAAPVVAAAPAPDGGATHNTSTTMEASSLQTAASIVDAPAAVPAAPAAKPAQVAQTAQTAPVTQVAQVAPAAPVKPAPTPKTTAKAPSPDTHTVAKADKPAKTRERHRQDNDVALVEAMLSHTSKPTGAPAAGPSVADQLRNQCGSLNGAAAATCRARICVSNPGASVCHESAP